MSHCPIAVLGEALVDEFHDGPVAGGAPFNVARSLAALGVTELDPQSLRDTFGVLLKYQDDLARADGPTIAELLAGATPAG